ncbi:hypothetical protein AAG906_029044 [Vitis piasezkii]
MTWYLQSTDLDVWDVIEDDPTFPTKLVDGVLVPKPKQEWNELDRRNFQLNAKVVFTLQCAMDRNEYNRICQCKSAKEIWSFRKNLQRIREGDEDIEVSPIKVAYQGHCNSMSKDLTKLPMEDLIGSLMTYEINLTKKLQEATTKEEEDVEEDKPSDEDDDLALITRKLNKYMRCERFRGRKFTSRRDPSKMNLHSMVTKRNGKIKRFDVLQVQKSGTLNMIVLSTRVKPREE